MALGHAKLRALPSLAPIPSIEKQDFALLPTLRSELKNRVVFRSKARILDFAL